MSRSILLLVCWMLLVGGGFMIVVARQMTQPLESPVRQVDAFGTEREHTRKLSVGMREIAQQEQNFTAMEARVPDLNKAKLESEKLATIGSMATSVSHDLRHNLATIYAHAEFLMDVGISQESGKTSPKHQRRRAGHDGNAGSPGDVRPYRARPAGSLRSGSK